MLIFLDRTNLTDRDGIIFVKIDARIFNATLGDFNTDISSLGSALSDLGVLRSQL
jgi:hypothetical protein